ncbi:DUF3263 domain-containing protein [Streptomyces sp. NPDC050433]|uniref:DUF3263 domain-containing protein n=1 Tax=unclassified Streptomyces TaxID=2593676 RepID=UPI0034233BDB
MTTQENTADDGRGSPGRSELTDRDRAVLAVEQRTWPGPGAKERVIREQLGISPTRYYQLLGVLIDDPLALVHDPVTVNRLRRIRDARRARR